MDQRLSDDSRDLSNCSKVGGYLPKYSSCYCDTWWIVFHSLTSLIKCFLELGILKIRPFVFQLFTTAWFFNAFVCSFFVSLETLVKEWVPRVLVSAVF